MKTAVIGTGMAGLTAALTMLRAGHHVELYEQASVAGGVTRGIIREGFHWDYGQLNIEGLGRKDPLGLVLNDLGILQNIEIIPDHRDYIFPDFALRPPEEYTGSKWRIDTLKVLFPEDAAGLEQYWKDYVRFTRLMTLGRKIETDGIWSKISFFMSLIPLINKKDWTAKKLLDHYFKSEELKAVFVSILADFFTPPSQFLGLGVFALNAEKAYDERIPDKLAKNAEMIGLYSLAGGTKALTDAFVGEINKYGGQIHFNCGIKKINVEGGRVTSITDEHGKSHNCDTVLASGGAKEILLDLVEPGVFPDEFVSKVKSIPLMDSVFMLHLGTDYDFPNVLKTTSNYFYGSYDIEGQVKLAQDGVYHEGEAGFVVHIPTRHSPEMAPAGNSAMTIYTICPDRLKDGDWERDKDHFAEKLLDHAEKHLPNLRSHIKVAIVVTPEDLRKITHLQHHAFGGVAPLMNAVKVPHKTPVDGLWFIGAQSESGGGINNVIPAAHKTALNIVKSMA